MYLLPCVCSIKHLLVLTVVLSLVLHLFSHNCEGNVVEGCIRDTFGFSLNEWRYLQRSGDTSDFKSEIELEEYAIERTQRPFECISGRLQGSGFGFLDTTPVYRNLKQQCEIRQGIVQCDFSYPYRTIDGTCNNPFNVKWGSVDSCVKRLLPPSYEGVSGSRRSVCGFPLPQPRTLSLILFENEDKLSHDMNTMFVYFSQLIAHDVADIPKKTGGAGNLECCSRRSRGHPQCAPIHIPMNDPHYSELNVTCLNFIRAVPCGSCTLGKRNIMTRATSYIDCSFLYGLSDKEARSLRTNDGTGKMKIQRREAGELLPPDVESDERCGSLKNQEYCFDTGDERSNQQTMISSLHTVFLREHNRIADEFHHVNRNWGDEKIYQEARRIVTAQLQSIVYKELLPDMLGSDYMTSYDLEVGKGPSSYDPSVNPNLYAEFVFGAYRLHSLIPTEATKIGVDGGKRNLSEFVADSAEPIYHGEMDKLLKGMILTPSGLIDIYYTSDITETLFSTRKNNPGVDLLSTDIQRGRDAGIPPYTEIIRYLSNGKVNIQSFSDLESIFRPEDVRLLKSVYCDPRDIDYYVGLHFEPPVKDELLWKSAADIVARQFRNWKFGDRFYFEHFGNFRKDQLRALEKVTLSTLLCENTDLQSVPEHAMHLPSARNPVKPCEDIPKLDLEMWKD